MACKIQFSGSGNAWTAAVFHMGYLTQQQLTQQQWAKLSSSSLLSSQAVQPVVEGQLALQLHKELLCMAPCHLMVLLVLHRGQLLQ